MGAPVSPAPIVDAVDVIVRMRAGVDAETRRIGRERDCMVDVRGSWSLESLGGGGGVKVEKWKCRSRRSSGGVAQFISAASNSTVALVIRLVSVGHGRSSILYLV